jgi:hypothetical protein
MNTSILPYVIVAIVVVSLILSRVSKPPMKSPTYTERVKLNTSLAPAAANKTHFFSRVLIALTIFVVSVALSMFANYEFDRIRIVVGKLSERHEYRILWSLGLYGINVTDFILAIFLASVASLILGEIAKSRTVYILAALVGVMISGWLWHPC